MIWFGFVKKKALEIFVIACSVQQISSLILTMYNSISQVASPKESSNLNFNGSMKLYLQWSMKLYLSFLSEISFSYSALSHYLYIKKFDKTHFYNRIISKTSFIFCSSNKRKKKAYKVYMIWVGLDFSIIKLNYFC